MGVDATNKQICDLVSKINEECKKRNIFERTGSVVKRNVLYVLWNFKIVETELEMKKTEEYEKNIWEKEKIYW